MIQKNRVLILDFDSTLISIESLDLLAEICLENKINSNSIITKIKTLTSLGVKGKIALQDSLKARLIFFVSFSIRKNQL